jgi:hypothetical protein
MSALLSDMSLAVFTGLSLGLASLTAQSRGLRGSKGRVCAFTHSLIFHALFSELRPCHRQRHWGYPDEEKRKNLRGGGRQPCQLMQSAIT